MDEKPPPPVLPLPFINIKPTNQVGKTPQPSTYKSDRAKYTGKKENLNDLKKQPRSK